MIACPTAAMSGIVVTPNDWLLAKLLQADVPMKDAAPKSA
jgi:hypothetical protein